MAGYGIASGLLSGLSGLPRGMQQADELNLQRERLDEQKRQFDQSRATDTSSIGIPGMTPNALIPYLAGLAKTKEEAARKAALGQDIAGQLRAMGTTTSMAPGASVEMPKPGALMAPPTPGPMPAMTQQTVDPKMAALARLMPGLLQTHPETAGAMLKDVFIPPKPVSLAENATLVDPRTGQPIGPPRPQEEIPPFQPGPGYQPVPTLDAKGRVKSTRYEPPSTARQIAEGALKDKGWSPDMPGYGEALYQLMTPLTPITEGGAAVPRTFGVPSPPGPRVGAIDSRVPPGQQPTVQAAGAGVRSALDNAQAAANGLPGIPGPQAQARPGPQRMPGGGIQGPPKTQAMTGEQTQKIADLKGFVQNIDKASALYKPEYVGPIEGAWLGWGRQKSGIKATESETEFRTLLKDFANGLLYLRSGAAVTPQEYERILEQLPNPGDPDVVFTTKLRVAKQLLQQAIKNREAEAAQYGVRGAQPGGGPAPAAPAQPGGGVIRWGRDPQTGRPVPMP